MLLSCSVLHHHCIHIENEVVEYVSPDRPEFKEIIEEYLELLEPGEFPEPPAADTSDTTPTQGKPWCITHIFMLYIYIYIVHLCCRNDMKPICINICIL